MRGHNICFHQEIRKIIFDLFSIPCLIWSSDQHCSEISNFFSSPGQSPERAIALPAALVLALAGTSVLAKC